MTLDSRFDYLEKDPEAGISAPPVETSAQLLPFDQLTWENFERLCYRIARAESDCEHARLFGERGQDQSGIDLYCRDDGGYTVYQCRRVTNLSAGDIARAVGDFLAGEWAEKAHRFVFCTSLRAVRTELSSAIEAQASQLRKHGITFQVWDAEELSARLKEEQSSLVGDFFGPAWRDAFLFDAPALEISAQLANMSAALERLEQGSLKIRFVDWAPSLLRDAVEELGRDDARTYAKLDDAVGDPPQAARVVATVAHPPEWLAQADARAWRLLALMSEQVGEWDAAFTAWVAAADRTEGEARAGFLVAASAAADVGGDATAGADLLRAAEEISPRHPRVVLQRLDQRLLGPERLHLLEGLESDDPPVAALLAVHRAAAHMLVPNMGEAERFVAEAKGLLPDSLTVRAIDVNAVIHRGRIASNEHRAIDYTQLRNAFEEALRIREDLREARRYEESMRLLMLAADASTVMGEPERTRALIRSATPEEIAAEGAAEVLGDAALRANGWREALSLTEHPDDTEGIQRIRASAQLESGGLYEQNRALETLDELIRARGREASPAALYRLAATVGRRRAEWSDDAFDALLDEGFSAAALTARALFVARRQRDYASADALLVDHAGEPWADHVRLEIAVLSKDRGRMRALADAFIVAGAVQDDLLQCAAALVLAGEHTRARDILTITARDAAIPPATRADAYSMLVTLVAGELNEWDEAARFHDEWVGLRPGDDRASAWAPRIANRRGQRQ